MKITRKQLKKLILQEMAREKLPYQYEMLNYIKEDLIREFGNHEKVVKIKILEDSLVVWLKGRDSMGYRRFVRIAYSRKTGRLYLITDPSIIQSLSTSPQSSYQRIILDLNDDNVFHKLRNYIHEIVAIYDTI